MLKTLEDRLRERSFGLNTIRVAQKAEDQRAVALAVADYLQDYPAVSNLELRRAIHTVAVEPGHDVKRHRVNRVELYGDDVFMLYSTPSGNKYLSEDSTFNYLQIQEAIKLAMGINEQFRIKVHSGMNNGERKKRGKLKGHTTIYFETVEGLREYFSTRIQPASMTYLFN